MNCTFQPLGEILDGKRRWKCSRCGQSTAPTIYTADRIHATCTAQAQTCVHLGEATGRTIKCGSCAGGTRLKVFACEVHGECTIAKPAGIATCAGCQQFTARGVIGGEMVKRFDETNLSPGSAKRFNASIAHDPTTAGGGYIIAYRDGWAGSEVHLIRLDRNFSPVGESWNLRLRHSKARSGREDPRLFMHAGRLHVAYAGVVGRPLHTNVLYARLTEDCSQVEANFFPRLAGRNQWEKNWAFFSSGGELFAIYSVAPHRILRINGEQAEFAYESPNPLPWSGGERRGGAAPVLIGNEWWHFFHDRVNVAGMWTYRTGLYTFANEPPFRVLRYIPEPIMVADASSRPGDQYCACVFTCGAILKG